MRRISSCLTSGSAKFGVYLILALILNVFAVTGLKPTVLRPVLAVPLITLLAIVVIAALVMLICIIPNAGRKIT